MGRGGSSRLSPSPAPVREGPTVRLVARRSVSAMLLSSLTVPLVAFAEQGTGKIPKVGYLSPGSASDPGRVRRYEAFRRGLRELGYVEGQNISLEPRWAEGEYARYTDLLADLI